MSDKKISELTALTAPDGAEELVVNDSGTSKKITQTNLLSTALPLAGGTMTGTIAGFTSTGIDDNATSTAITIDSSENVGIGNSAPTELVTIGDASNAAPRIQMLSTTTGTNTIHFGDGAGVSAYRGYINYAHSSDSLQFASASTERMRIDSTGDVLVGTTSIPTGGASTGLSISENGGKQMITHGMAGTSGTYTTQYKNANGLVGGILISGSATSYNTSSDYRLKENVVPMTGSIDRLKDLKPSRFNFKADADKTVDGFLAHEAAVVVPECATGTKDAMRDEEYEVTPAVMDGETVVTEAVMGTRSVPDYQGIDQSKLVPLLVASLQEAVAKIESLEARVTALEV